MNILMLFFTFRGYEVVEAIILRVAFSSFRTESPIPIRCKRAHMETQQANSG